MKNFNSFQTYLKKKVFKSNFNLPLVLISNYYYINKTMNFSRSTSGSSVNSINSINSERQNNLINPWFISGFTDAEGSFMIKVQANNKLKTK